MPRFPLSRQLTLQHSAWCCVVPIGVVLHALLLVGPVRSAQLQGAQGGLCRALCFMHRMQCSPRVLGAQQRYGVRAQVRIEASSRA